ncbi:probable serine/threonine-protein kinase At1g09600 [Prosopis cineraria]|uniref:probable serine/threonine-protein kinase At1g09600 n=1 Tax=Prosopis cineraria TaxID=364024 RepID=UPI00240EBF86|nr:probable serine/threonine-protein kinase At1g09600 [Prosopis cineraria]XP_054795944.1 probable serine/threonine-protein kinase At1g09600 [Prosopis cineraria]
MGCICSKGKSSDDYVAENHTRDKDTKANRISKHLSSGEKVAIEADGSGNDATTRLISNPSRDGTSGSTSVSSDEGEKNGETETTAKPAKQLVHMASNMGIGNGGQGQPKMARIVTVPKGERGAQVLAGWPSWLTAVAGEAINGWIPRRADAYEKLEKIGQGTYSSVYRARDLETSKIVALKKIRFANMDPESVRFMAREIIVLRRLDHPNVMKLEGIITSRVSGSLYLVFEYMEHDLAGLSATPGIKFTEGQIKCYMQQLLCGIEHCHSHGVLHRDIKGSNLLIDKNGILKIGDFGLATFFEPSKAQVLTSRVVTLWYRPPELLLGATNYGVAVDLWSAGCILAELFAGKPIMPGRTEVEQLHKIFKLCGSPSEEYWKKSKLPHATIFKPQHPYKRIVAETFKDFPPSALSLLEVLLAIEPEDRGTASLALQSEFFATKPLPCDPSTLPKYPPSKEFDVKIRQEEARRRRAANNKRNAEESASKVSKESKAVPAPDANAELRSSIEKRQGQANPKCISEKFNPDEDGGSGFPIEPSKTRALNAFSHSGQSMHPSVYGSSRNMNSNKEESVAGPGHVYDSGNPVGLRKQRSYMNRNAAQLSRFSNSVANEGGLKLDMSGDASVSSQWPDDCFGTRYDHLVDDESNQLLKSLHKKDIHPCAKEPSKAFAPKNGQIYYSGPLVPGGENLDEILKENEKQIQQAVRKARLDKVKISKCDSDNGQTESLLHHVGNR